MKNMKKIIAVLMSLTAIASTTAFASEATYKNGTASLALAENEITAAANDQLTVVIVPTTATEITSENIYYINQGAFEAEFKAILADMKVKEDLGKATDYEVRIGGVVEGDKYVVKTFKFKADILYGDVNKNGSVNALDIRDLKRYTAKWTGYDATTLDLAAADVNANGSVNALDIRDLKRYTAKWTGYEKLPIK